MTPVLVIVTIATLLLMIQATAQPVTGQSSPPLPTRFPTLAPIGYGIRPTLPPTWTATPTPEATPTTTLTPESPF